MIPNYQAILFDLDGVIINSEPLHARAKKITLEHYGIPYPDSLFDDFKGRPDLVFWKHVSDELCSGRYGVTEMDAFKRNVFFSLTDEMEAVPGALNFLEWSARHFRLMALVTSATGPDLMVSEKKFGLKKWFDLILLGEDTQNHKPHPEPYLLASERLGMDTSETLVIEDSPNGVTAASIAGCHVIGISTGFSSKVLKSAGAALVANSYDEIRSYLENY